MTLESRNIDQDLINRLQRAFTTDEERVFAQSFQMYLKYGDNTTDFIVDLEQTYRQVGFSRKDNARRLLVKKFKEGVDYRVFLPSEAHRKDGRPTEMIKMTIPCFKKFCLKADTKQADKVHDYYVKMEGVMHEHIKQTLETKQIQLMEEMAMLRLEVQQQQTYEQVECKGHVYVLSTDKPGIFKVGRAKITPKRVQQLQTGNVDDIEIVLDFATCNDVLLEMVVHYILERYRSNSNREHFCCKKPFIVQVVQMAGSMINTMKSSYHTIDIEEMRRRVIDSIEVPNQVQVVNSVNDKTPFYKFLSMKSVYSEGAEVPMSEVREAFSNFIGKTVTQLDQGTLYQVDKRYVVKRIMVCKFCRCKHVKGCCEDYEREARTCTQVVENIRLM